MPPIGAASVALPIQPDAVLLRVLGVGCVASAVLVLVGRTLESWGKAAAPCAEAQG